MHPLLFALHIATLQPIAADITPSTVVPVTPSHYVSSVGYEDMRVLTPPDTTLVWPTKATKLTRGFSMDHSGMDIDARTGDAVLAVQAGVVTTVTHTGPYGNKIIISHPQHPEKISTLYAHLTDAFVTDGQLVTAGETIGTVGTTGYADGDHLHFEVRVNDVAVDPVPYF